MISQLEWNTLQQRRAKIRLITLYKIIHNLIELPKEQYLLPPTSSYHHQALKLSATLYIYQLFEVLVLS